MAFLDEDLNADVRKTEWVDKQSAIDGTKTKMSGAINELDNEGLFQKKASGELIFSPAEGSNASFKNVTVDELAGTGNRNVGVDENGKLIQLASTVSQFDYVDYNPALDPAPAYQEGRTFYDEGEKTLRIYNDNPDFGLSVGQTQYARCKNQTGATITKGTAVEIRELTDDSVGIQMFVADAFSNANKSDEGWAFAVATEDTLDGEYGSVAFYGAISNMDTSGLIAGKPAYLGMDGAIVAERPDYPAESVLLGTAIFVDGANGVFQVYVEKDNFDYEFSGCILERQETNIVADLGDGEVYLDVSNLADANRNLKVQLGGSIYELDTTTGAGTSPAGSARIALLQGTVDQPQEQIVYAYIDNGVATLGTSAGYPAPPFAIVSEISIRDVATVDTEGPDMDRRVTSAKAHDSRGRISYITERWAIESPKWWKGVTPTVTIDQGPTPDSMNLSVIAGTVYQTHRQDFPALSVDTDGIYVANGPGGSSLTNYTKYNDLYDVLGWVSDSTEGRDTTARGNLVVFGVVNKDTDECKLFVNLPSDLYGQATGQADNCYFDVDNTADYTVPNELRFTAFLICRIPYLIQNNTVEFSNPTGKPDIINLLGTPIGISGGASGGSQTFIPPLTQVLQEGNDAGGQQIKNIGNGDIGSQDAASVIQMEQYADTKMEWKNQWVAGTYQANAVVRDGEWTMVANKETSGRPAPQPVGETESSFPVETVFIEAQDDSVVHSGHTYTFTKSGWVKEIKVYVTELTSNTNYRIVAVNNSTGDVKIINDPILTEDGFATVAIGNTIVNTGTSFTVFIDALNSGVSTSLTGGWEADGNTNNAPTSPAGWTKNSIIQSLITKLRFDKTDLDSVPRENELLNAVQGTTILMTSGANNFTFVTNSAPVDGGSYVEYTGNVTDSNGTVSGTTTVSMDIPVPQDTKYAEQTDYWLSNQPSYATVQGYLALDGIRQSVPNNAYGIDVIFQEASVSEDWDLLAFSGGGSGGGSAGESLWSENNDILFPTEDYKTKIGLGTTSIPAKFEVNVETASSSGDVIVTGSNVPNVNGTFSRIDSTTYQNGSSFFIKDTGWYWCITSSLSDVWGSCVHYGAGNQPVPVDDVQWNNYQTGTGNVFTEESGGTGEAVNGISSNSTIIAENSVVSETGLQIKAGDGECVIGREITGAYGVGIIDVQGTNVLFDVGEINTGLASFQVMDDGSAKLPLCETQDISDAKDIITLEYFEENAGGSEGDLDKLNASDGLGGFIDTDIERINNGLRLLNNNSTSGYTQIRMNDFNELSCNIGGIAKFTVGPSDTEFFSPVSGYDPVDADHFVTKSYLESNTLQGTLTNDRMLQSNNGEIEELPLRFNGGANTTAHSLTFNTSQSDGANIGIYTTEDFFTAIPVFEVEKASGAWIPRAPSVSSTGIDAVGGSALITKGYADANYGVGAGSKKFTFHKSGTVSGNVVMENTASGSFSSGGFFVPDNITIKKINVSLGSSQSSQATNITVRIARYGTDNSTQYSVGNGETIVDSEQLFVSGSALPASFYRSESVDINESFSAGAMLFVDFNTLFYTCQDVLVEIEYMEN